MTKQKKKKEKDTKKKKKTKKTVVTETGKKTFFNNIPEEVPSVKPDHSALVSEAAETVKQMVIRKGKNSKKREIQRASVKFGVSPEEIESALGS